MSTLCQYKPHREVRWPSAENMTEQENTTPDRQSMRVTNPICGKVRRRRTVYSRKHLDLLLKTFEANPYPGISVREKLSHVTGVHESRIQVWFQNRRARKNKKKYFHNGENLPQEKELLQFDREASKVNQTAWNEKELCRSGFHEKHEHIYKHRAVPIHPLSHLHINTFAGPQHLNSSFPCQASNTVSSGQLSPADRTTRQYHQCVYVASSSHQSHASASMERNHSEHSSSLVKTLEPVHGVPQESSLRDILEEFQPCWTEVANNSGDVPDDLLCLF